MSIGYIREDCIRNLLTPSRVAELVRFDFRDPKHEFVSRNFLVGVCSNDCDTVLFNKSHGLAVPLGTGCRQACKCTYYHNDSDYKCKNSLEVLHSIPPNYLSNRQKGSASRT